jgi:hypothetical protein
MGIPIFIKLMYKPDAVHLQERVNNTVGSLFIILSWVSRVRKQGKASSWHITDIQDHYIHNLANIALTNQFHPCRHYYFLDSLKMMKNSLYIVLMFSSLDLLCNLRRIKSFK